VEALFGDIDQPRSPELTLTLALQLMRTLDLTNHFFQDLLGTNEGELTAPFLEDQMRDGEAPTQRLGRLVFASRRFSCIRVPSAARSAAENFVILPARFDSEESVRIYDDRGRWRQVRVGSPR
jgi:hypothetical protein